MRSVSVFSLLIWCVLCFVVQATMLAEFKMLGAGLACSGLGGVGQGIGSIFSSLVEAIAINPSLAKGLFNYALIGFALTEAVALFILMITFLILF